MNNQPNTGDIATCSGCGMKIQFDGQEWKHLSVHFKHPAEPAAPRHIDTANLRAGQALETGFVAGWNLRGKA